MSYLRRQERQVLGGADSWSLNGTTSVDLVPACPAGYTRVVECVRIAQLDDVDHTIRIRKYDGSSDIEFDSATVSTDEKFDPVDRGTEVRLIEDEKITALMDEAMSTTNPSGVSAWRDEPLA